MTVGTVVKYRLFSEAVLTSTHMFLNRNKKNITYPCKPQFYYMKVGFKGLKICRHVFVMLRWTHMSEVRLSDVVAHI